MIKNIKKAYANTMDVVPMLFGLLALVAISVVPCVLSYYQFTKHADIAHISIFMCCFSAFVFFTNIFKEYPGPLLAFMGLLFIQTAQCVLWFIVMTSSLPVLH